MEQFQDLEELGIEPDADDSLTDAFNKAANHLQGLVGGLDNASLLTLYGYYKQGQEGPCNVPKPSWYDLRAKSKWEAWNGHGDMPRDQAKQLYIDTIKALDPEFTITKESWVFVSTPLNQDKPLAVKTAADFVKDGDCSKLSEILKSSAVQINARDEEGLALVHWAADRGSLDILKTLVEFGADVNLQDLEGQTPLHYAASCGHFDCVVFLLESGAQKNLLDNEGVDAQGLASDETVKDLLAQ